MSERSENMTRFVTSGNWCFDIAVIPRDRPVIVEVASGKTFKSHFCEPTKTAPKGWWSHVGSEDLIVAWQPWPEPSRIGRRLPVTRHSIDLPIICDDVGSGA
ncbi:MAG: hypothetical protein JWQ74_3543 [Marmoricola sp.]|nr:hypothetical protein [Marmoricola sp.]